MQSITLQPGQSLVVDAQPVSDLTTQAPGLLDGNPPAWTPGDLAICTVDTIVNNGLRATVHANNVPGSTQVQVFGHAPNSGSVATSFLVTVAELAAVGFIFTFGTPS